MVKISGEELRISDYRRILFEDEQISLSEETLAKAGRSYDFLRGFLENKIIYGVNTGLGPMAQYRVEDTDQQQLQYNLIRSHAAGSGEPLPELYVKAAMISRLKSLSLGYSGVHTSVLTLITRLINENITPYIPVHGGVGASGDLVQLAHIALTLIGEGEVMLAGQRRNTADVFKEKGIEPLKVYLREGLGLINGTSVMSGIGVVNIILSRKLLEWAVLASAMINEIVQSFDDHFSAELNQTKKHKGQQIIAGVMRNLLADSQLIEKRSDRLYNGKIEEKIFKQKIQEYYSLRCVPQILGPVADAIEISAGVLVSEINSANDNPVIDPGSETVYHGGNFHGDYVSYEMDKLKIGITKLSMLAERQINFLMNHKLNDILPPFVNLGTLGLNLGLQGTQFTATSTVAENQTMSNPVSVHSIPNNNDNQDIVSMGTNAAWMTNKVINNAFEVLAVEFMAIIQAIDFLKFQGKLAHATSEKYHQLRKLVPVFTQDTPKYADMKKIGDFLKENNPGNINLEV